MVSVKLLELCKHCNSLGLIEKGNVRKKIN